MIYDINKKTRKLSDALSLGASGVIPQRRAAETGVDPHQLAGHSLRHTFVSFAADYDFNSEAIARVIGHRKLEQGDGYRKGANPFSGAARAW